MKTRFCALCENPAKGNLSDDCLIVCSGCVQKLYNMTDPSLGKDKLSAGQKKLKKIYQILIDKGYKDKADLISMWITEEEVINESRKDRTNMDRKRSGSAFRRAVQRRNRKK